MGSEAHIDVWWAAPHPALAHLESWLDEDERNALHRLRRADDRLLYGSAHALTRLALGTALGVEPATVRLNAPRLTGNLRGKPIVTQPRHVEFSLTHTRGLCGVAVSSLPVGLDAEPAEAAEKVKTLGEDVLSSAEQTWFEALPPAARPAALLRQWVRKEAVLKAIGVGISQPMAEVAVPGELQPMARIARPASLGPGPSIGLRDLMGSSQHLASLAWAGDACPSVTERHADSTLLAAAGKPYAAE